MASIISICILVLALLTGCATGPDVSPTAPELTQEQHSVLSQQLTRGLAKSYGILRDPVVEKNLYRVASALLASEGSVIRDVKSLKLVLLNTDDVLGGAGLSDTIYVSKGLLKTVQFENELAFVLAANIVLLDRGVPAANFADSNSHEIVSSVVQFANLGQGSSSLPMLRERWFAVGGFFDFGSQRYLDADIEAIRRCYAAQFDPRGAATLFARWRETKNSKRYAVTEDVWPDLPERLDRARSEIAKLTPLRDPIVKSKDFDEFHSRLQSMKPRSVEKKTSG
jgi:predicted Zn-dependent protease